MALSRERTYYKAVRRAVAALNSSTSVKEKLEVIVRGTARSMKAGTSLVLLDANRKKLIHSSSRGLPQFYLRKGVLDADVSLSEVITGQPVIIPEVAEDSRIQFPEIAAKAGIVSIVGIPVMLGGQAVGSLRIYTKERNEFSNRDINFVTTMANMAALAISGGLSPGEGEESGVIKRGDLVEATPLRKARSVTFAHPSEEEFARILDFYNIEWVYEPHSFLLRWEGERATEMFTPDFYLPGLDLYLELTTLKQSLVTEKNRKLRRLRELYPEVKVTLLYKKDYDHLLAKYGAGPLAQTRAHGISRVLYATSEINERVRALAGQISRDYADRRPVLVGVQRGFLCFMADLIRQITIPIDLDFMAISYYGGDDNSVVKITKDMDLNVAGRHVIMVEDIVDTGMTLNYILNHLRAKGPASLSVCTLLDRRVRRILDVPLDYIGFEVPDEFVVGYGLDYREEYRNLPFIGIPRIEKKPKRKISRQKD
ncbi:MAG: hypoxanthine phosphoribosyltransferase [Dehalococcoidia bacterium]|nr:MAG: hypoxanthine phosphoribosyltransferase [Dehalococcoidia bacterium]